MQQIFPTGHLPGGKACKGSGQGAVRQIPPKVVWQAANKKRWFVC